MKIYSDKYEINFKLNLGLGNGERFCDYERDR